MARGKRRAPVQPAVFLPPADANPNDEVDDFVAHRHKALLEKAVGEQDDSDDLGAEPENHERGVLNIDSSDSDSGASDSSEDEGGNEGAGEDREDRKAWGGKKKLWYGADTHEYEIMDDDEREEALQEEEDEAVRLQREALSHVRPEHCKDEEEEDTDAGEAEAEEDDESKTVTPGPNLEVTPDMLQQAAPEVSVLFHEMLESRKQASIWKGRVHWNEVAGIRYHLHAAFVNNVAFYLSLRTDPESVGIDLRSHPVLVQIVRVRSLLKEALALPCDEPGPRKITANLAEKSAILPQGHNAADGEKANGNKDDVDNGETNTRKRKKRKRKSKTNSILDRALQEDEEKLQALLPRRSDAKGEQGLQLEQERKRKKLNKLVGDMERDRKNEKGKRMASADAEILRTEPSQGKALAQPAMFDHGDNQKDDLEDDDEVMQKMLAKKAKKEARKARKAAEATPHVYTFKDSVDPEARRKASSQVVKNRGLTRYRPKDKKTPRTKNRLAYSKAVVRRKGAVRDYAGTPGSSYAGEASGINMSARKGSRLSNV